MRCLHPALLFCRGCPLADVVPSKCRELCPAASASNAFPAARSSGMGSKMNEAGGGRPRSLASEELSGLMQRVAARDAASLRTLYERTSGKLYGICLRLLGDETEAQDVLQEVYVTVWQKARMFD
jgi:RNA polymerase sigma-70 factor (ECF subfamily)